MDKSREACIKRFLARDPTPFEEEWIRNDRQLDRYRELVAAHDPRVEDFLNPATFRKLKDSGELGD